MIFQLIIKIDLIKRKRQAYVACLFWCFTENKNQHRCVGFYFWHPQWESNLHLTLRRGLFYPLNYEGVFHLYTYYILRVCRCQYSILVRITANTADFALQKSPKCKYKFHHIIWCWSYKSYKNNTISWVIRVKSFKKVTKHRLNVAKF